MADDNKLDFILDLDDTQFAQAVIGAVGRVEGLGAALSTVAATAGLVGAAFLAVKTAVDLTFEAEQIKAVNAQFEILARQAGLAGDAIKEGMVKASGGLVDDTELLQLANKAIIDLGQSAARLPEIMELARRVSMVTGESIASTFQNIEQAVATGQTRALKNYGIVVDSEKAYREYAASLGIAANALSKTGQSQAIMNAALAQGQEKYKNVQVDVKEATNAWQAFKVTMSDIGEIVTLAYDRIAGEKVRSAFSFLRDAASSAKTWFQAQIGQGAEKAAAQTEILTNSITELKVKIIDLEQAKLNTKDLFKAAEITAEINQAQMKLKSFQEDLAKVKAEQSANAPAPLMGPPIPPGGIQDKGGLVDKEQEKRNNAQFQRDMNALEQEALDQRKQMMTSELEATQYMEDQKALIKAQSRARIAEIEASTSLSPAQKAAEEQAVRDNETMQIQQAEMQRLQIRQQAIDNLNKMNQDSAQGFANAWEAGSRSAQMQLQNWNATGQRTMKSFEGNATNALLAFGAGTKTASEAAKAFVLGMLADEAEARGKIMLLASIWPPNPAGFAAGAGLIALAGYLRSQGAGSSAMGGGGAGGGGGGGAGDFSSSSGRPDVEQDRAKKAVTIQINGNYFETEQTKTRLVEMIREASDATDFNVTGGR